MYSLLILFEIFEYKPAKYERKIGNQHFQLLRVSRDAPCILLKKIHFSLFKPTRRPKNKINLLREQ